MIIWNKMSAHYRTRKTNKNMTLFKHDLTGHVNTSLESTRKTSKCRLTLCTLCVWLCLCFLSHPVPVEPWWGPLWPFQSPALCRPRWLQWCPTGGHTRCPTCPPSAPQHGPPQAGAPPSDAPQAGHKKEKLRWEMVVWIDLETLDYREHFQIIQFRQLKGPIN